MKRPWQVGAIFVICFAGVVAAMAWVTTAALRLDRAEAETRRLAELEDRVRLALWRMDSSLARLLARENGRPFYEYSAFYPASNALTKMFAPIDPGDVQIPSQLLTDSSPHVLLYFQFGPKSELTSPQVPCGNSLDVAEQNRLVTPEAVGSRADRLVEFHRRIPREALASALPVDEASQQTAGRGDPPREELLTKVSLPWASRVGPDPAPTQTGLAGGDTKGGWTRSQSEAAYRQQQLQQSVESQTANTAWLANTLTPRAEVEIGPMTPLWLNDALILARRVRTAESELLQGCWLDWPAMKTDLLSGVADLLPSANLTPCPGASGDETRRLAALPLRLEPNESPSRAGPGFTAIRLALIAAWACVLLGAAAVAFVMTGTLRLSERRAAFVSAVTHELRTPLTTFRLYTDMLADNGVDAEKRTRYVETIRNESDRLAHLVENVLDYARLERGRAGGAVESIAVAALLERLSDRLQRRAEQAGMRLVIEVDPAARDHRVSVDPSAVERILYNLVDNACKYAARAEDRTIHIAAHIAGGGHPDSMTQPSAAANARVEISVRDHGPGIRAADARRLFRPFHKSARDAAHSAPGVGLGLALSQRLARGASGELRIDGSLTDGARFVLRL